MLERSEQVRSKPTPFGSGAADVILLQQFRKEGLRQIVRFVDVGNSPPDISVERIPVRLAERFESRASVSRRFASGGNDHAPLRCGENVVVRNGTGCGIARFHSPALYADRVPETALSCIAGDCGLLE